MLLLILTFFASFFTTHGWLRNNLGEATIGIGLFLAAFLTAALR